MWLFFWTNFEFFEKFIIVMLLNGHFLIILAANMRARHSTNVEARITKKEESSKTSKFLLKLELNYSYTLKINFGHLKSQM